MEPFNISRAIERYDNCRHENQVLLKERQKKTELLMRSVKKQLEACKDQQLKHQYTIDYLSKEDIRAGLKGDIPDEIMSHKTQSMLQKFLLEKLVLDNRGQKLQDIVPDTPSAAVVQRKFKSLVRCEKKLKAVGENYILEFVEDWKEYFEDHQLEPHKMKVREITQFYEHLWGLHEQQILAAQENEFDLVREKGILLDYIDGLSEADKKKYMKDYFIKTGVNGLRFGQKLISEFDK